jgi:hypothetical protein
MTAPELDPSLFESKSEDELELEFESSPEPKPDIKFESESTKFLEPKPGIKFEIESEDQFECPPDDIHQSTVTKLAPTAKNSNLRFTHAVLKNTIEMQIDKTELTLLICDSQMVLEQLNDQVRELTEEHESLMRHRLAPSFIIWTDNYSILPTVISAVSDRIANVETETAISGEFMASVSVEIDTGEASISPVIVIEPTIASRESDLSLTERAFLRITRKNVQRDKFVEVLTQNLQVITPSMMSFETMQRTEFEGVTRIKQSAINELEGKIQGRENEMRQLNHDIDDLQFIIHQLKQDVARIQRDDRPDVIALSHGIGDLRNLQEDRKKKIRLIEIESQHYDVQTRKLHDLIGPKSMSDLQGTVWQLRDELSKQKQMFAQWMRRLTKSGGIPLTNAQELFILSDQKRHAGVRFNTLKRRACVVLTKIEKSKRQLTQLEIRVPSRSPNITCL